MNLLLSLFIGAAFSHGPVGDYEQKAVMADTAVLRQLNIPILMEDQKLKVGISYITPVQEQSISRLSHALGRCGGFESLEISEASEKEMFSGFDALQSLREAVEQEEMAAFVKANVILDYDPVIAAMMEEVSEENLENTIRWLSEAYPTRYHRSESPNAHVEAMKTKLEKVLEQSGLPYELDLIQHQSTPQKSIRARLIGSERPNEIVVLGGHLDSIVQNFLGQVNTKVGPGADDNASGSANLLEALRIISAKGQPKRSVEFFWYAGEEAGLLGSAEIAQSYKQQGRDVIGVMQIDMSLNPGAGEMTIGSATDFTSLWLRELVTEINHHYLGIQVKPFRCGYGCSDHASWFRQGFATVMPFESTMDTINPKIHTKDDVINSLSSFKHSAVFSKLAIGFAMTLGNTDLRQ